jgi:acetoin:2,6-dichlorophenolindophenol oxidoreductase subunit alpha
MGKNKRNLKNDRFDEEEIMALKNDDLLKLYRGLILSRNFEEKVLELYRTSKIHEMPHSGIGMEAVGIGALTFLRKDDYAISTHRGYSKQIGKGVSLKRMLAEFYGRQDGYGRGKDSHHFTATEVNLIGKWGLIGSQFPLAVGLGLAAQVKGEGQVCVILFGDGCSNRGTFHESLNLASVWKLPIVWVCENNGYSSTTPMSRHTAAENIADYAKGYRMPGITVDGNDVIAVHEAIQKAAKRARRGGGPSLIELITYYTRSHNEKQNETRPPEEIKKWRRKDPVLLFREKLMKSGLLTKKIAEEIDEQVCSEIEEAVRFAEASPAPEPGIAFEDLFAES